MPTAHTTDAPDASALAGDIVDAVAGIVFRTWPETLPAFGPPGLRIQLAQLSRTDPFGSPLGSDTTAGCTWWDADAAVVAALGEALEWYSASLVPSEFGRAAAHELDRHERVELTDLALYAPEQRSTPGFPFQPLDAALPIRWARGTSIADGRSVLVPASLTYLGYTTGPTAGEPLTNLPVNAGLAAHTDPAIALASALGEVVERDAVAEAWTFHAPLVPLALPAWFTTSLGADDATTWRFYRLPTRVDVAGVLAVVRHHGHAVVGVGAAVRADPIAAARKAAAEAMVAASGAIEIDRADSRQCARLVDDDGPLSPWRSDRAYRRSYREDWRDAVDIACHAQLYVDPVMQAELTGRLDELSRGQTPIALESLPQLSRADDLASLLLGAGFEPLAVDVTTSDVAGLGWRVVRAVVPGLRPTGPAAFPYLGETRRSRPHRAPPYLGPIPHV